jgi:hypothetical protein
MGPNFLKQLPKLPTLAFPGLIFSAAFTRMAALDKVWLFDAFMHIIL